MEKRKRLSGKRRCEPGQASTYIKHADEVLRPGDPVILVCRVSGCMQDRNGNLKDQDRNLSVRSELLELRVVGRKSYTGSGFDPSWLLRTARKAQQLKAALFAETTDRFIRCPYYHSKNCPNAQARETDLQDLQDSTLGVLLVTDLHPDASPARVRSYQRKRGQQAKGRKGGRPPKKKAGYKKQRRLAKQSKVIWLGVVGMSVRRISILTGIPFTTVQRWRKSFTVRKR